MSKESLRFFDDNKKELAGEVKLTKEEVELFENFEWAVLCNNGLRQINGGWSAIEIHDIDEDDEGNEVLVCEASCGVQDMGNGSGDRHYWGIEFNRKTQKFEER